MQTLHILVNPHAGAGRAARLVPQIQAWAATQAGAAEVQCAPDVAQGLAWVRQLPMGARLVLAGGDGTLNQLLPAVLERDLVLGLIPCGSGNDAARALGLFGLPWNACLTLAQSAATRRVDVGWLHAEGQTRPFLSSLTVGFDSAVGYRALHGPRALTGLPRYLLATLRELGDLHTWDMQVRADGRPVHQGTTLFASTLNTPTYASGMPAVPHAQMDDGQLDLLIAGRFNAWQALAILPRLLLGRHLSHPRVHSVRYRMLEISSNQPLPLATDGEYVGESSWVRVEVAAGALQTLQAK